MKTDRPFVERRNEAGDFDKDGIEMAKLSQTRFSARSAVIKRGKWVVIILAVVATITYVHFLRYNETQELKSLLNAMYEELEPYPNFDMLLYKEGKLYIKSYEENCEKELPQLPLCIQAMQERKRVKGVEKRGDDVYFTTSGIVDNYHGFVLSRDTNIEMGELMTLKRKLGYGNRGINWFYFSSME